MSGRILLMVIRAISPIWHLPSEPGRQRSRIRASEADPSVPPAQIEALADVLVKSNQVSKSK